MKTIAVVTDKKSRLSKFLKDTLESIFEGFSKINNYYMNELQGDSMIADDMVLFMIKENALACEKHVLHKENIISLSLTGH